MKKFLKTALSIFVVTFVSLFLLEDACQLYVRFVKSELMPKYDEQQNSKASLASSAQSRFKPSPFFGYVSTEGNNYGFISNENYPIARSADTYVVAILGGSVAFHLANHITKDSTFATQLKKNIPALKDKDIQFMPLALTGYKQPQQHIALSYFLEHIDMAIQVDGWNEVFVSSSGNSPVDFPGVMDFENSFSNEKTHDSSRAKIFIIKTIEENSVLKKSMALFLLKNSLEYKIILENQKKSALPKSSAPTYSQDASSQVNTWSKFIKQEKHLLKAHNKKSFFFVQASQYNPQSKVLTEEEKRLAVNTMISDLVAPKFQLIRAEAKRLGVYDLADVFKNETASIYIDNCCHVNDRGNQLVAEEILRVIARNFTR